MRAFATLWLVTAGAALAAADTPPAVSDKDLATWVDARVQERLPTADERRFDEVGWVKDLREAERLAKERHRPIFLFTHDGRMNVGRC
jgi:hypothetical protein